MNWLELLHVRVQWQGFVHTVMNVSISVSRKGRNHAARLLANTRGASGNKISRYVTTVRKFPPNLKYFCLCLHNKIFGVHLLCVGIPGSSVMELRIRAGRSMFNSRQVQ
jgi:hypothetical protein